MRPQTLPVGCAGVVAGTAIAMLLQSFRWIPALLCLLFAILAQIASNFANEYFDFRNGLDSKGRDGFRRGVTEGDITPPKMLAATFATLTAACAVGCGLICWGGLIMIPVGIIIALFALGYSAGPYPLSYHGLGDIAVVVFFGIVPVCLTAWLQCHTAQSLLMSLPVAAGIGILAANVLIVNNYRDIRQDRETGKRTTAVIFGRRAVGGLYLLNVLAGMALIFIVPTTLFQHAALKWLAIGIIPFGWWLGVQIWNLMRHSEGRELNDILRLTAMLLLIISLILILMAALDQIK